MRTALASASIDLFADSHCVPNHQAAETNQTEQKPGSNQETEPRLAEQGGMTAVSTGQSPTPGPTTPHPCEAEVMAALEAEWESEWAAEGGNLKLFYLMREALAPLVEAVLLVDRAVYLSERINGGARRRQSAGLEREDKNPEGVVRLFPLFDPALSPRNICLFASAPERSTGATSSD